jgi:hypothetical protein
MPTYRYKLQGPDITRLTNQLPDTPTLGPVSPTYQDITVASTSKADLDEQMLKLGYAYISTDPLTTPTEDAAGGLVGVTTVSPVNVTKAAAAIGTSTQVALADHKHDITTATAGAIAIGDAAAEGNATSLARSNHTHSLAAPSAPVDVTKAAASTGSSPNVARQDHKHDVSTAVAGSILIGDAAAEGTATSLSRSDHKHALVAAATPQAVGTANATGTGTAPAREDHVHAITFTTINGRLAAADASISVNSQKITNLADPTAAQDAANKQYVDSVAAGIDWKGSVRASTTAALPACTYANGASGVGATLTGNVNGALAAQDGVTLVVNNRLLVKNQAAGLQNGIYALTQVGTAGTPFILTRATDCDSAAEVTTGVATFIEEGSTISATGWVLTTANPITIGTTALTFAQFSGASLYLAGNGLVLTGNTFDVVANADGSIVANANDVQVGVLATDAQHGVRGGGTQHAAATTSVAGFQSAADKTKQDAASFSMIQWGNDGISSTTTTRFMTPGYGDATARTSEISFKCPKTGTLRNLYIHVNGTAGNGNNVVYTVRKAGADTSLTVTLASTSADGSDTSNTVSVTAGDLLSLKITKASSIGTSPTDVMATCDLRD